jgi:hypothetical protein
MYKEIVDSPYSDYRAITDAAQKCMPGFVPEGKSEDVWKKLLESWLLANVMNDPYEYYGYKGKLAGKVYSPAAAEVSIGPGEAVYSGISETRPLNSGYLTHVFAGLGNNTVYPNTLTDAEYTALRENGTLNVTVSYNSNTDPKGPEIELKNLVPFNNVDRKSSSAGVTDDNAPQPVCPICTGWIESNSHAHKSYPVDVRSLLHNYKW